MKRMKLFLLMLAVFTSSNVMADGYNGFGEICKIYYGNRSFDEKKNPEMRRTPPKENFINDKCLSISFEVPLPDAVIVIQCNGEELYSENCSNIVCGDTFTYSLTEVGEYTTFVYVNGELVEEETILVNP